jgi:hypothetical protein
MGRRVFCKQVYLLFFNKKLGVAVEINLGEANENNEQWRN